MTTPERVKELRKRWDRVQFLEPYIETFAKDNIPEMLDTIEKLWLVAEAAKIHCKTVNGHYDLNKALAELEQTEEK